MTGYVRQSAASIIAGAAITAAIFNAEFNQLQSAFNGTTGHGHTGGTGDGPKLLLTGAEARITLGVGGVNGTITVDSTKVPVTQLVGAFWYVGSFVNAKGPVIATGGNQYINFGQDTGTSGESWSTAIVGNALGVSRTVGFYCEVPITGW